MPVQVLHPIDLRVRTWFNPGLKSPDARHPWPDLDGAGLPGPFGGADAGARTGTRHTGTMLATPIGRGELLLGKIIPYIIVACQCDHHSLVVDCLVRDLVQWQFPVVLRASALFLFAVLSMGMIVGVFMRTQAAALAMSFLVVFFPGFFLTGIFFPLASMPEEARLESMSCQAPTMRSSPRHIPAGYRAGCALAIRGHVGGAGRGLHADSGVVLSKRNWLSQELRTSHGGRTC